MGTFFSSGSLTPQHEDQVVVAITVIIKTAPTNFVSLYFNHRGESVWTVFWFAFPPVASPKQQKIELGRER